MIAQRPPIQVLGGAINYTTRWGMVSYWKLDEASDTRSDTVGTNHLTDNNTVTQDAGKLGNAAKFLTANSEFLSIASNSTLQTGDVDFWLAGWIKPNGGGMVAARDHATNGREYTLSSSGTNVVCTILAGSFPSVTVAGLTNDAWQFFVAWHDSVGNTINVKVNNGTTQTTSMGATVPSLGTAPFTLGARGFAGTEGYFNGLIDAVAFGKSPPGGVAGVITEINVRLYNSGSGREYPWN